MTQIEFENQMRELRTQKGAELTAIAKMQGEVKEEIAAIDRQVKELRAKREKLNQQRIMIANRRFDMEQEWGKRIKDFFDQNYTTSRELENVSEWALAILPTAHELVIRDAKPTKGKPMMHDEQFAREIYEALMDDSLTIEQVYDKFFSLKSKKDREVLHAS